MTRNYVLPVVDPGGAKSVQGGGSVEDFQDEAGRTNSTTIQQIRKHT